ncbi:MAG: hypothetical protein Kow00127_07180 [Bacteroidales bacterium]
MKRKKKNNSPKSSYLLLWLTIFAIAMGYLESAVVVYLRKIYYPDGFDFPLTAMDQSLALTEVLREAATMVMLLSVALLTGRNRPEKFGNFLYLFGWWDVTYYLFLYLLLGWPSGLLTWDILFLLPSVWTGPVLAPVLNSFTMIALGLILFGTTHRGRKPFLPGKSIWVLLAGALLIFISYIEDFLSVAAGKYGWNSLLKDSGGLLIKQLTMSYVPESFNWILFGAGQILLIFALMIIFRANRFHR